MPLARLRLSKIDHIDDDRRKKRSSAQVDGWPPLGWRKLAPMLTQRFAKEAPLDENRLRMQSASAN